MKLILSLAALAVVVIFVRSAPSSSSDNHSEWENYKNTHRKSYSKSEDSLRKQIYNDNKAKIDQHNELYNQGLTTYTKGTNQFTDMTEDERKQYRGAINQDPQPSSGNRKKRGISTQGYQFASGAPVFHLYTSDSKTLPASVDYRTSGWTTTVRNQGQCGSCWAFSASTVMSYYQYNKTKTSNVFSPQQLVDCGSVWGASGCNGGSPAQAFEYMMTNKQALESNYPYTGVQGTCQTETQLYQASGFVTINSDVKSLQQAVALLGPVAVSIHADYLMDYSGGIWNGVDAKTKAVCNPALIDHAVTIVGYGTNTTTNTDYWIIQNSWGTSWGENGFFQMVRNSSNLCGILSYTYTLV